MWKAKVWGIAALLTGLWVQAAGASLIVFDNYGPDWSHHDVYGWTVSGAASWARQEYHEAAPFVAAYSGHVTEIWLTLAYTDGTNAADVWLAADAGGVPGTVLGLWTIVGQIPPHGPHPLPPVHLTPEAGPSLVAGQTYWLVVSPRADDTYAMWYWNPGDSQGTNAYRLGQTGAWTVEQPVNGSVFRVDVAPDPATVCLLGLGGGVGLVARRRHKGGTRGTREGGAG